MGEEFRRSHFTGIVRVFEMFFAQLVDFLLGNYGILKQKLGAVYMAYGIEDSSGKETDHAELTLSQVSGHCSLNFLILIQTFRQKSDLRAENFMIFVVGNKFFQFRKSQSKHLTSGHHPFVADEVQRLDIVGSFPDGVDPAVPKLLRDGIIFGKSVASVALHCLGNTEERHVRTPGLDDRRVDLHKGFGAFSFFQDEKLGSLNSFGLILNKKITLYSSPS
ncbi:MAG: hypothetical protein FD159_2004 [Syntrophaceae bacterium]|nr:MAG: hypothetical protein FD159_2004 [Syntrophaceae bacterium]